MAIGNTTQWASGTVIQPIYEQGFYTAVFRNNDLLGRLPKISGIGDTAYRWKLNSVVNSSAEIFTESGTVPQAMAQTYVNAAVTYLYFRAAVAYTGHARDALMGNGMYAGLNAIDLEFQLGIEDIRDLINTTFITTNATCGLETVIDSSTNYAGITRSAATYFQSYEHALSGSLTQAELLDLRENVIGASHFGRFDALIMPPNQLTNLQSLPGAPGAQYNSLNFNYTPSGGAMQFAPTVAGTKFGEADVWVVRDMTTTVIASLDLSAEAGLKVVEHRPFTITDQAPSGDNSVWQLSWAGALICNNPVRLGKSTGITA